MMMMIYKEDVGDNYFLFFTTENLKKSEMV